MSLVIDAYNNAWQPVGTSDYLTGESHTIEEMISLMDAGGVDKAVVCSLGQQIDNEYITSLAATRGDRLIGFAEVNPRQPDAGEVLEEFIGRFLKGNGISFEGSPEAFRSACLSELNKALKAKLLSTENLSRSRRDERHKPDPDAVKIGFRIDIDIAGQRIIPLVHVRLEGFEVLSPAPQLVGRKRVGEFEYLHPRFVGIQPV